MHTYLKIQCKYPRSTPQPFVIDTSHATLEQCRAAWLKMRGIPWEPSLPWSEAAAMEEEWVLDIVELRLGYVVGG